MPLETPKERFKKETRLLAHQSLAKLLIKYNEGTEPIDKEDFATLLFIICTLTINGIKEEETYKEVLETIPIP